MITSQQHSIPLTDKEAWLKYPKLNWVYDTARLFDFQKIEWTPFPVEGVTNSHIQPKSIDFENIYMSSHPV